MVFFPILIFEVLWLLLLFSVTVSCPWHETNGTCFLNSKKSVNFMIFYLVQDVSRAIIVILSCSETIWLSTSPTEPLTHWYQVRCLLKNPVYVKQGQNIGARLTMRANSRYGVIYIHWSSSLPFCDF